MVTREGGGKKDGRKDGEVLQADSPMKHAGRQAGQLERFWCSAKGHGQQEREKAKRLTRCSAVFDGQSAQSSGSMNIYSIVKTDDLSPTVNRP